MPAALEGTIAPEKILRELDEMWASLAQTSDGMGALRACSMTLVTLAEASEDFAALGETLAALMPEHPARNVVVKLLGAGGRKLSERVYSQCWRPFGQKRQVCCEQVEITAPDAAVADLPSVILPLAVADLPLVVWCRSARVAALPEFGGMGAMAQRVILDSARAGLDSVVKLAGVARAGDLAWTRLTPWRSLLSQTFENRRNLEHLPKIDTVTVEGRAHASAPLYLAAWVLDALAAAGARPRFEMKPANQDLAAIELSAGKWSTRIERLKERLIATTDGVAHCHPVRPDSDYHLMREELGIVGEDAVFERVLASTRSLPRESA